MSFVVEFTGVERLERQAPPPHPSPLKGEGVGGGVGLAAADRRAEAAEWVRQNLPTCSAVAAAFRQQFGNIRLVYASENGNQIGKPTPDPGYSVSGDSLVFRPKVKQ